MDTAAMGCGGVCPHDTCTGRAALMLRWTHSGGIDRRNCPDKRLALLRGYPGIFLAAVEVTNAKRTAGI